MKKGPFGPCFQRFAALKKRCRPKSGAGDESRTRDLNLGKVALYQLSYSRIGSVNCPEPLFLFTLINLVIDQKARSLARFFELVLSLSGWLRFTL
jgi:hypothetical protein